VIDDTCSRTPAWIAIATLVHAAALAALVWMPIRPPQPRAPSEPQAETEITVTLESEPPAPLPGASRARERADEPPATTAEARRPSSRAATPAPGPEATSGVVASVEPSAAASASERPASGPPGSAPSGGAASPIPFTAAELGIGGTNGRNPFLPRAEEKPPADGADHPAARAMRGTGLAHDRELGLGPEGPAIAALGDATSRSIAPLRGRARFVVRTGGDGLVLGIDLLDSDGGPGWSDAGRIALESLRGKKMKLPRGATGMNMHIEIRSEMKLPNGENAPVGARLGDNKMPEFTIPDVSNIGQKPRRVVHARAVGTEVL
jgi:hypothetical protein